MALRTNKLTPEIAARLMPDRATLGTVWRYLATQKEPIRETPVCLCRKIVRWSGVALGLGCLLVCLEIFSDVGLLQYVRQHKYLSITLSPGNQKADLNTSATMQILQRMKES